MHTVPTFASTRCRSVSSLSTLPLTRRVDPNATSVLVSSFNSFGTRRNSSSSFGFAPGHPASMKCTPSQSSCSAIRSLSSTVSEIPSNCDPSRRVVSYISMLLTASLSVVIPVPTTRSYELAPVFVLVDLAAHGLAVLGSDHLGHSTGTRDRTVVDRVHGADLGRGSAHEHLLG